MTETEPSSGAYLRLFLGALVIVGLIAGLVWSMEGGTGPAGRDRAGIAPELAVRTDPQPTEGATRRALDLGWETECAWQGTTVADPIEPAALTDLYLDLTREDLDELYTRSRGSNTRLPGTYRLAKDGPSIPLPDASVRFRGRSARALPKPSFNVRLHEPLAHLGTDRLNLNGIYTDPAMVREHLSMQTFRHVGIAASRTSYVDLYLNDVYEGLYLYVQRVDEQILADRGLNGVGATLVRDRSRDRARDSENVPTSIFNVDAPTPAEPDALAEVFDFRGEPDWETLAAFIAWVRDAEPNEEFADQLPAWVDVDGVIDFLALHTLVGDVDAYYDDYWLYRPAGSSQFGFIPWDKDLTYGAHFSTVEGGVANVLFSYESPVDRWVTRRNRLFDLIMTTPGLRARHDQRVGELIEKLDLGHYCAQLIDFVPKIAASARAVPGPDAFVRHGSNHVGDPDDHDLHVASVLDHVQRRGAFLDRQMADEAGPVFRASQHIGPDDVGTSVLFTGSRGWTIARLDVLEVETPGIIDVEVSHAEHERDVDRRWSVRAADGARVRGQLSLYYRNTPGSEDWVQDGSDTHEVSTDGPVYDPVAMQRELTVVDVSTPGEQVLQSVVNPFANRVAAEVEITGERELALRQDHRSELAVGAQPSP